jgi:predicted nucleic acid-binding protein
LEAYEIVDSIEKMRNLTVLEVTPTIFTSAREYLKKFKLMSNDAISVATCKVYGIKNIATTDADFERVDFLKVWKP